MENDADITFTRDQIIRDLHNLKPSELDIFALHVRALSRYRDPKFPERHCDNCQEPYRGPAVYCCFACALADN